MLTPTISFPDDLIASGTVFAIVSTFSAVTPEVAVVDPLDPESPPAEQPETARVAVAAKTVAMRHIPRRISHPPNTVASTFCIGQLTYGRLTATTTLRRASAYCAVGPNFPRVACKVLSARWAL
jgi:hypothetical protein